MTKKNSKSLKLKGDGTAALTSVRLNDAEEPKLNPQKMITRQEVAKYLKVSVQSVINYTNHGLLTSYKIGRRVLYNETEVINAIQNSVTKHNQDKSNCNNNIK